MSYTFFKYKCLVILSMAFVSYTPPAKALSSAGEDLPVSHFSITEKEQIPNVTLSPGTYLIRVLDHLSDRMVLQVENDKGKLLSTFLALPNKSLQRSGAAGKIFYDAEQKSQALRGFSFENGTIAEFVYPKAQAVAIAQENSTKVPAIDPASEGMPVASKMSSNDMALVNLWLLSPTLVGKESKPTGILAQRYTAPGEAIEPEQKTPPQVARLQPPPAVASQPQPRAPQAPQVASVTHNPALVHLPHTAGFIPLVGLLSLGFLAFALVMRRIRLNLSSVL